LFNFYINKKALQSVGLYLS